MTDADRLFTLARSGDADGFGGWCELVHLPVRDSLRRFARRVDVEAVVQETFLRMWIVAQRADKKLEGRDASLRFALRVARNVALETLRRDGPPAPAPDDDGPPPEQEVVAPEPPDPLLRRRVLECLAELVGKPADALLLRLRDGHRRSDRQLAAELGMKPNTFLQNIVRARRLMAACLESKQVSVEGLGR